MEASEKLESARMYTGCILGILGILGKAKGILGILGILDVYWAKPKVQPCIVKGIAFSYVQ